MTKRQLIPVHTNSVACKVSIKFDIFQKIEEIFARQPPFFRYRGREKRHRGCVRISLRPSPQDPPLFPLPPIGSIFTPQTVKPRPAPPHRSPPAEPPPPHQRPRKDTANPQTLGNTGFLLYALYNPLRRRPAAAPFCPANFPDCPHFPPQMLPGSQIAPKLPHCPGSQIAPCHRFTLAHCPKARIYCPLFRTLLAFFHAPHPCTTTVLPSLPRR